MRNMTAMDNSWTHASKLRELREAMRISQEEAARRVRVGIVSYGRWERGEQSPSDENLKAIAEAFRIDPRVIGYKPPHGWELLPSPWISRATEGAHEKLDRILALLEDRGNGNECQDEPAGTRNAS